MPSKKIDSFYDCQNCLEFASGFTLKSAHSFSLIVKCIWFCNAVVLNCGKLHLPFPVFALIVDHFCTE